MQIPDNPPGYSYEEVERILFLNKMRKNKEERPSENGYVTIKDLGVYETSILCDDEWVPIAYMESALPPRGQDQFDLTPSIEIAKRVVEIGEDREVYCRATSDDLWSAYQQALKDDTRIRYRLLGDAEVKELFGL
tara:strand:+ start:215 stop:619 length:405 start_codon:yes stop_codon:yes gene_type:complete